MKRKTSITGTGEAVCPSSAGTAVEHTSVTPGSPGCSRRGIPPHPGRNDPSLIPEPDTSPGQVQTTTAGPDTAIIVHELGIDGVSVDLDNYLRKRGIVHRAMQLLEEWKFQSARISSSKIPVDIVAFRKDISLLVQAIYSKKPLPGARTLMRLYAGKIQDLLALGSPARFRKILMAYSAACGWKYYDVLPGGLIPAWDLPEIPAF